MKRRQLLKASIAGGTLLGAGAAWWMRSGDGSQSLRIDAVLQKIDELAKGNIASSGVWNPHQIFTHCAQSIEYSMLGYPAQKPKLFQDTVGTFAFSVFSSRGKMAHGLSEPIVGAPALEPKTQTREALARLRHSFVAFQEFGGTLAPHFAYGKLSKREYEVAHVMHFWNHLDEITV